MMFGRKFIIKQIITTTLFLFSTLLIASFLKTLRNIQIISAQTTTPTFNFATYWGPDTLGGTFDIDSRESAVDSQGNIIVTGYRSFISTGYQGVPVYTHGSLSNPNPLAVAKLSSDGSQLLWIALIGGNGNEHAYGVAIGPNDHIYVAGKTFSTDFPTTPGAWDRTRNAGGATEIFVLKLSSDGRTLLYSTYLGGDSGQESARGGLAVDAAGSAYVVGSTGSPDFLDEGGVLNPRKVNSFLGGNHDAVIVKMLPDGSGIDYARFLGGGGVEVIVGASVDSQGRAYVFGHTDSVNMATTSDAFQSSLKGADDGFLAVISPDGTNLEYSSYYGGSESEYAEHRLMRDYAGNIYVAGATLSPDFPLFNAHQSAFNGPSEGFLIKFNSSFQPVFATLLDGMPGGPAVDNAGNVLLTGITTINNFETTPNAFDRTYNGGRDAYFQMYSPIGTLLYSTYLGGSGDDGGRYVTMDNNNNAIISGTTQSADFPVGRPGSSLPVYDTTYNGVFDVYVGRFSLFNQTPTSTTTITSTPRAGGLPGDANGDDKVDGVDYVIWLTQYLNYNPTPNSDPDFNGSGTVDGVDYVIWLNNYGN